MRLGAFLGEINSDWVTNVYSKAEIKEKTYLVGFSRYEQLVRQVIVFKFIKIDKAQDRLLKLKMKPDDQNPPPRNDKSFADSC